MKSRARSEPSVHVHLTLYSTCIIFTSKTTSCTVGRMSELGDKINEIYETDEAQASGVDAMVCPQ